jgi:hypothetical protein
MMSVQSASRTAPNVFHVTFGALVPAMVGTIETAFHGRAPRSPRWVPPNLNAGALSPERDPCLGCEQPRQAEAGRAST